MLDVAFDVLDEHLVSWGQWLRNEAEPTVALLTDVETSRLMESTKKIASSLFQLSPPLMPH